MESPQSEVVSKDNPMKEWLVNYVGETRQPKDGNVTVLLIVEQMLKEFPEFLMLIAEENFMRGYQQAVTDLESSPQTKK